MYGGFAFLYYQYLGIPDPSFVSVTYRNKQKTLKQHVIFHPYLVLT